MFVNKSILSFLVLWSFIPSILLTPDFSFAATDPVENPEQKKRYENLELFQKILHFVEANYVDEIDNTSLIHGAIKGMMQTLDPHSNFLPPDIYRDMKIDTSGKFGGLGIEIGLRDKVLTVVAPIEGTPAWRNGIKPGDRIVKINGVSTKGLNLSEAVSKMRGKPGSKVKISIFRKGFEKIKDVELKREIIKVPSIKQVSLEPNFGYVRLASFNENAAKDVHAAIGRMEKSGKLKGLVFDLRTNPGGLLDQAVAVSSLFLDRGVVVSTIGRNRDQKEVKHVRKSKIQPRQDFPIAVLVNSSTASAAEIVAGALQDHKRAVILGEPTFGKGSVQSVIDLGNDMGLKLTISRYYTPSGRSIQQEGVHPDILLDQYNPKLLAKAKVIRETLREKDLFHSLEGVSNEDFSDEELQELASKKKEDQSKDDEEDMSPLSFDPSKDYQVVEALNFLKSYQIFKKLGKAESTVQGGAVGSATATGVAVQKAEPSRNR